MIMGQYTKEFVGSVFRTFPARKESVHVISYDGAPGCPARRKPLSWKTYTWIDRFLYAIVVVVMPVAL